MSDYDKFGEPAVLAYIEQLQGIISRLASNSTNCKACATAILAGILTLSNINWIDRCYIALIPTVLFLITDSYYLGLERKFRSFYNKFISEIKNGGAPEVFNIPHINKCEQFCGLLKGLNSFSTFPFYLLLGAIPFILSFI